jgi:hypothetical protein
MPIIPATHEARGDQEDCSSNQPQANSLQDPISKKSLHKKRAGAMAQVLGSEFKPKNRQTNKPLKSKRARRIRGSSSTAPA